LREENDLLFVGLCYFPISVKEKFIDSQKDKPENFECKVKIGLIPTIKMRFLVLS
jgi:hypothetical protein